MTSVNDSTEQYSGQNGEDRFLSDWLSELLQQMAHQLPPQTNATLLKACALAHYRMLNMDYLLSAYRGNLPGFLEFLAETWHWKIEFNRETRVITADENKAHCVCPLVQKKIIHGTSNLCACSEGFAERMFAAVIGKPVRAEVSRSILRGDQSCVYTIHTQI